MTVPKHCPAALLITILNGILSFLAKRDGPCLRGRFACQKLIMTIIIVLIRNFCKNLCFLNTYLVPDYRLESLDYQNLIDVFNVQSYLFGKII